MTEKIKKTKKRKIRKSKKIKKTKSKSNKIYKNPAVNLTPQIIYQSPLTQTMAPIESKENFNKIISLQNDIDKNKIQLLNRLDDEKKYFDSMGAYVLNEIKQLENKPLLIKDLETKTKRSYIKKVLIPETNLTPKPLSKTAQAREEARIKREAKAKLKKEREEEINKPHVSFDESMKENVRDEIASYELHKAMKERNSKDKTARLAKDKHTRENIKNNVEYPEYDYNEDGTMFFNNNPNHNPITLASSSEKEIVLTPANTKRQSTFITTKKVVPSINTI